MPVWSILIRCLRLSPAVQRFQRDESGATLLSFGLVLSMFIGFTALAIDGASYYNLKRRQQTATDLAALAAAAKPAAAVSAVTRAVVANGYQAGDVLLVEPGQYTPDPSIAPAQRFVPGASGNAVRVTLQTTPPFIFGKALRSLVGSAEAAPAAPATATSAPAPIASSTPLSGFTVRTQAIGINQDVATFSLGTGVAQLDGGLLNSLLGPMLGTNLSLSLLDYQGLAATRIDLLTFSDALATRIGTSPGPYNSLLSATVQQAAIFRALQDVTQGSTASAAVANLMTQLANRVQPVSPVMLSKLLTFGPYGARLTGSVHPVAVSTSVLDLVSAMARLSAEKQVIKANLALSIPGIASATLTVTIHEPSITSSMTGIGTKGAMLNSAQTRLQLNLKLVGTGMAPLVSLPLYVSLAQGTARLAAIDCSAGSANAGVTLGVAPGLVTAAIGTVSDDAMAAFGPAPTVSPAFLLNLAPLAQVTGSAQASISQMSETAVPFSAGEIAALTHKTTSTTDITASLVSSLVNNLDVQVTALGSPLLVPLNVGPTVSLVIGNSTAAIDQILNQVLGILGVSVGNATTWISGVRCGQSMLVN